jgi:gliding motility-associated-like protein
LSLTIGISAQNVSEIKGVVNKYVKVTSIINEASVNISSPVGFVAFDTVMIVQIKGAIFASDDPNVIEDIMSMGKYELTVINSIVGNTVTFNSPLKNTYNASESVQLIRIPSYENAKVTEELTCKPWDGESGGVLAVISSGTIELNADINVSGMGFRGADPVTFTSGSCFVPGVSNTVYNILNYRSDSTSGKKGEGAITNTFLYTRGKGPSGNGGGAGSGAFSGGGGGGNFGLGGKGAKEGCAGDGNLNWGGNGGRIGGEYFSNSLDNRRIYLGGGGGSGIQEPDSSGTNGGNGGGIIIILSQKLITNGYSIKADGNDVAGLVSDGSSSGGGGGGGMVLLSVDSTITNLKTSAKGGKGGSTTGTKCVGQGGGGGGGFVWFSGKLMSFSELDLAGGLAGSGVCYVTSIGGSAGDSLNMLQLPLTGFLNNFIYSVSQTCYNIKVDIKGSTPKGGNGVYTYLWEYWNKGSSSWVPAPGKNDSIGYKTSFLTDTTKYRRTVTSDGMHDYSRPLTINVFPEILNNFVDPDTIVCNGSTPFTIRGSVAGGGKGNFQYEWSTRTLTGPWAVTPDDVKANKNYTAATDESGYYRRKVTSEYCSTYDSVKIEVLPPISNNLIVPRQTLCSGSTPTPVTGTVPQGGTSSYTFQWEASSDSLSWTNGGSTAKDLGAIPALTQTIFYRRIVMSGLNNCCSDISKNVKIIVLPVISNNSVTSSQTICEATKPDVFNGSLPTGGDSNDGYRYNWETSKNGSSWTSLQYSSAIQNYSAAEQDSTHFFRRVVYSGLNDCCKNISNNIKVTVHPKIENNLIKGDTTICQDGIPSLLTGSGPTLAGGDGAVYSPKWMQKDNISDWSDATGIANQFNYQPSALSSTVSYQRQVISGACTDYSNIITVNVLNKIEGNVIAGNEKVCDGHAAEAITGTALSGGEPGVYRIHWEKSLDGQNNWETIWNEINENFQPGILGSDLYFRRYVKSGDFDCCQSISNALKISIDKNPSIPVVSGDRDLNYQDTINISALTPEIGSGEWTVSPDASINNPENPITNVTMPAFGRYVFYWTISNGVCPSVQDSVVVILRDLQRFTGFSPNGDGVNDQFIVEGLDNSLSKELTILNQWGSEVYKSSDYKNDWEGKDKNGVDLPEGTYYYVLKVNDVFNKGKYRVYKGYVVMRR